ncbi:FMN-binding protein [Kibdelosporangium lantanae]|uniref:FMN-binding protein n=1 Tax=Kibdelosporangium lantanae TaxID=1497396 RepID=A0ABW3MHK8_9PSEU
MRRITIAIAATITVVVLLFSYRTSTNQGTAAVRPSRTQQSAQAQAQAAAGGTDGTFTGDAVDTRYGPVQVRITLSGGKITSAQAVRVPDETSRDVRINNAAVPILVQETLQAQSTQIDTVSGATYTSEGYAQSLQSAIDAAHQ